MSEGLPKQVEQMIEPVEQMLDRLQVGTVFGQPTKEGDVTLIPVAEVSVGFGFGYGFGTPGDVEEEAIAEEAEEGAESGAGGVGGGAGGGVKPRGYIRIDPEGVRYEPIIDESRIALAGVALSAWAIFWVAKTIRSFARALEKGK